MTASYKTVEAVYSAVRRYVTDRQMELIIDDLLQIPGNKSFKDTIKRLAGIDARVTHLPSRPNSGQRKPPPS